MKVDILLNNIPVDAFSKSCLLKGTDELGFLLSFEREIAAFERYNAAYRERFGFPFVICVRDHDKDSILAAAQERVRNEPEAELRTALAEIARIAHHRLEALPA